MVPSKTDYALPVQSTRLNQRDEAILQVATKIFARKGYRNADVQEIADELGIGKGTIYRTFGTKEELFLATVDYGMRRLSERLICNDELQDDSKRGTPEGMETAIFTFLSFFDQNPDLIELLMQERSEFKERDSHSYVRHWLSNSPRWAEKIKRNIKEDKTRNLPIEELMSVFSGMCYGAIFTHYFSKKKMNLESMAKIMSDIIANGILTDTERERRKQKSRRY